MKKWIIIISILIFIILVHFNINDSMNYIKYEDNTYIAVIVNGERVSSIPNKGNYKVKSICNNAKSSWDYDNWELNITNMNNTTKCMLTFSSVIPVNLAEYIIDLDELNGVYNEPATDYRYEGKNPNNYIMFNNELWRIIGVFNDNTHGKTGEKLVKIIRNKSLGVLVWDKNNTNDWTASSLSNLLNQYYYNGTNEPTINYCYNHGTTIKGNCDFTINGITNSYYRDMIENVTWKLGGISLTSDVATVYTAERGTNVYSGRPTSYEGKIGLMYPSDYGYSTSSSSCIRTTNLENYNTVECVDSTWLRGEDTEWTLTQRSSVASQVYKLFIGHVSSNNTIDGYSVRPTIYLKSNTMKLAGSGTAIDPYIIVTS